MTAEQLEELMRKVTQGEWHFYPQKRLFPRVYIGGEYPSAAELRGSFISVNSCFPAGDLETHEANATLIALAPSLARRVIAAEKLAEAVKYDLSCWPETMASTLRDALTAYREASK